MLNGSVAATVWAATLLASVHEVIRARDTGTPLALAKEQRMLVMLESVRIELPPLRTTTREDNFCVGEVASEKVGPSPKPMPSAAAARIKIKVMARTIARVEQSEADVTGTT